MRRDVCFVVMPALSLLAASALTAVEVQVRFGVETQPSEYDWSIDQGGLRLEGEDEFAFHLGVVGGVYGWAPIDAAARWAFIAGLEFALAEARDDDDGSLMWGEVRMVQGVAWHVTPQWGTALLLRGGTGLDSFSFSGPTPSSAVAGNGRHDALVIELGFDLALTPRWNLYTGAGWRFSTHRLRDDATDTTITFTQSGPTVALGLRWQ